MKNTRRVDGKSTMERGKKSEAGFTLVEVLSAMVIFAIAITAAYATFQFQHSSFTTQSRVAEAQQNQRAALEFLNRDIRLSGAAIPTNVSLPALVVPGTASIRAIHPVNRSNAPDEIYLLCTYNLYANLPPATGSAGAPANDIGVDNVAGFTTGDLVLITDGSTATDLFELTGIASPNLQHTAGGSANGYNTLLVHNPAWPAGGYVNATVSRARFARYFIDTTDPAHPTLMLDRMTGGTPQPVADDIEDMQFQYGLDTDNDGTIETVNVNDPTVGVSGVTGIVLNPTQIRQVHLFLSARSRFPEKGWTEARPVLADYAGPFPPDPAGFGYRRRTIDVTIDLRN